MNKETEEKNETIYWLFGFGVTQRRRRRNSKRRKNKLKDTHMRIEHWNAEQKQKIVFIFAEHLWNVFALQLNGKE